MLMCNLIYCAISSTLQSVIDSAVASCYICRLEDESRHTLSKKICDQEGNKLRKKLQRRLRVLLST